MDKRELGREREFLRHLWSTKSTGRSTFEGRFVARFCLRWFSVHLRCAQRKETSHEGDLMFMSRSLGGDRLVEDPITQHGKHDVASVPNERDLGLVGPRALTDLAHVVDPILAKKSP